ncbi:MAG: flavin reductase family protein [Robiginitalea sp.]|uniref:flavin reductase family protein n=1 Tax=Robiginitalea sp. TaxID=1902411 RepID=UPI003C7872F6
MENCLDFEKLMQLDGRYRANLINKIAGYKTANLIGTRSGSGLENLAVFNSVVHIGANPPYLGFVLRPATVERHTYENLKETGYYTINQITGRIHGQAHMTSAKFQRGVSEFEACGLEPYYLKGFNAPFVAESAIKIGLKLEEVQRIECNDTRLVIGKVIQVILPEGAIGEDGDLDLESLDTVAIGGLDTYYKGIKLGRYGYVRPGEDLRKLS